MKINYDKIADSIYINIQKGKITKTQKVNENMVVDLDRDGGVIGVEFLSASSFNSTTKTLEESVLEGIPVEILSTTPVTA
jgi:uncharacterized protein YuzE